MNSVNIIGRLTAAPEVRYTTSGKAVCELNLAVDDGWGENKKTCFFGVQCWDKTAELAGQHLIKGQKAGISGRLTQDEYTPKGSDKPVRKTLIVCERLEFLEKPKGSEGESPAPRNQPQQRQEQRPPQRQQPPQKEGDGWGGDTTSESDLVPF